jgi:hypothetical protein
MLGNSNITFIVKLVSVAVNDIHVSIYPMNIGLVAVSGKPLHAGHVGLIQIAASENDIVKLFVSTSDRKRPGELPILGSDMLRIWKEHLEAIMPENVEITYGGSPIANIWKVLGEANESGNADDTFTVYADPDDLATNFPEKSLNKYAGNLWNNKKIILKPIQRTQTVDVSGTKMRSYLSTGDKASFIKNLPAGVDGEAIWNILSKQTAEALLKSWISLLIGLRKGPQGSASEKRGKP